MKTQIGTAITGDFEDNTITFEIEGDMVLAAGKYAIVPFDDYNKIVKNNVVLDNVSNRRELLIADAENELLKQIQGNGLGIGRFIKWLKSNL
jgi:hypothetical protein